MRLKRKRKGEIEMKVITPGIRKQVKANKKGYRFLSIILLLFALHFTLPAVFAAGIGTTGAQFLKIGVGARPVGMGSSFVAVADDVNTAYWNPSGFSQIKGTELTTMYLSWFEGIDYGYVGYAQSCGEGIGFGGALTYLTTGDIPQTNLVGDNTGAYSGEDIAFILSGAKAINEKISLGSNIKIIQEKIESEVANGYAFDIGGLYKINQDTKLGVVVQNIGSKIKFVSESDALPLNWKIGASHKLLNNSLILALDINFPIDNNVTEHIGAEYLIGDAIALRLGYKTDTVSYLGGESGLSGGIGVEFAGWYSIDYAWVPYGDLGQTHRFSLLMRF